ncbi:hypothetical protein [Protaetiibacter mangrovi]|uniref:Uncharacterized protein n=1 Tax=Protaetiibacter mangrovi TaxID=2970926 RepID=A0ABT1ZE22_9MICO|nr:hypothetical protein [Protaetiibacter mangrovi]MCS0498950.1 hypothetical protein [Protaetiibacter mangrovi]TPX03357.1 hypothetical protein FJ656_17595 [Schumannella luteola]
MESRRRTALRYAARDVDPMSWFTGPYVPLVFAVFVLLYGGLVSFLTWSQSAWPAMQLVGVALCTAACVLLQVMTALRNRLDWQLGLVTVVLGGAGLVASALGYAQSSVAIELWWAPLCYALVLGSLTPYLAPWRLLFWGTVALVTAVPVASLVVDPRVSTWDSVSVLIIVATPVAVGVAGATAFSYTLVRRMLPIVDNRSSETVSALLEPDPADEAAEREALARFTARAVPFLRAIAERGTVTDGDRSLAGEIARYLRDDLVSRTDLAWLGLHADDARVVVVDPERRAQYMRVAQRTAIRDLVRAVIDDPSTDATTIYMELRAHDDGSTGVAITLDADLPEGRRVRHLSPYYFNLRGQMRDVRLGRDRLSFRVPPNDPRDPS